MIPATRKYCWFMDGQHFPGPDCPHDTEGKEVDETVPKGWTVQHAETSTETEGR